MQLTDPSAAASSGADRSFRYAMSTGAVLALYRHVFMYLCSIKIFTWYLNQYKNQTKHLRISAVALGQEHVKLNTSSFKINSMLFMIRTILGTKCQTCCALDRTKDLKFSVLVNALAVFTFQTGTLRVFLSGRNTSLTGEL